MNDDPIVAEVRRHRAAILDSFGGDLRHYLAALQKSQSQRFAGRLVTLTARKRVEPSAAPNRRPSGHRTSRTVGRGGGR